MSPIMIMVAVSLAVVFCFAVLCFIPWPLAKQNLQESDEEEPEELEEKVATPVYGEGDICPQCNKALLQVVARELQTDDSFTSSMSWCEVSCPVCGIVAEQSLR